MMHSSLHLSPDESASNGEALPKESEHGRLQAPDLALLERRGFELLNEQYHAQLDAHLVFVRHGRSGAQAVFIQAPDPHLSTEIRFRTLPDNDTGALHKIEHGVLSASGSVAGDDRFFELRRSLLLTEVNAYTKDDCTSYVASGLDKYSVETMTRLFGRSVLGGAPELDVFRQEHGILVPAPAAQGGFRHTGVVHDEMLPLFGNAAVWEQLELRKALFEGTPYAHYAGGNPAAMRRLSYAEFCATYAKFYCASQAALGFYGESSLKDKIDLFEEILGDRKASLPVPPCPTPIVHAAPREREAVVPVPDPRLPADQQLNMTLAWKFPRVQDHQERFELQLLCNLLGTADHLPFMQHFRRYKLDNVPSGAFRYTVGAEEVLQMSFERSSREQLARTRLAVPEIFGAMLREGFDPKVVNGLLVSRIEDEGILPQHTLRGKLLLAGAMDALTTGDPRIDTVWGRERAEILRSKLAAGQPVFEQLLQKYIVGNPDQLTFTAIPDAGLLERWKAEQDRELARDLAAYSAVELDEICRVARYMTDRAVRIGAEENLSQVPKAQLTESMRHDRPIPHELQQVDGATIVAHRIPAAASPLLNFALDLGSLSPRELSLAEYLLIVLTERGPRGSARGAFEAELAQVSSGLQLPHVSAWSDAESAAARTMLFIGSIVPEPTAARFVKLVRDALLDPNLDDIDFLRERAQQLSSRISPHLDNASVISGALGSRLRAALTPVGSWNLALEPERASQTLVEILARLESDPNGLISELQGLRERVIRRDHLLVHFAGTADQQLAVAPSLREAALSLPPGRAPSYRPNFREDCCAVAFETHLSGNYLGMATVLDIVRERPGVAAAAAGLLNRYLLQRLRTEGKAYTVGAAGDASNGFLGLFSQRDPNLARTVEVFRRAPQYLREAVDEEKLERAKIEAMGSYFRPESPLERAEQGFGRIVQNLTSEALTRRRSDLIDTGLEDIRRFADELERGLGERGALVVYANKEAINEARKAGLALEVRERFDFSRGA